MITSKGFPMRKLHTVLWFIFPLLASCNFPVLNPSPTEDLVATQVAINLTQAPTLMPTADIPTTMPTASLSTAAPQTSATNPAPSATATIISTPNIQPTATSPAGDPRSSLGSPTWKDTFQNSKSWGLESPYDDGNTRVEILNNSIVFTSANAKGWHGWRMSYLKPRNFYLEATIQIKTCSGNDQYGLIFRSPDNASGYWMGATCDGHFYLQTGDGGTFTDLIKSKTNDAIQPGSNQTNRLGVMIKDDSITLYANGKLLDQVTDTTFSNAGTFGLFIAGQKTLNFSVACTEIDYWDIK
jgi:hypothetical protein